MRLILKTTLVLLIATNLFAVDRRLDGVWKAVFTGPTDERPKMVSEMVFIIRVEGNKLTGLAHMSYWPGDTEISDGKVEGDRVSFTTIGKLPWSATSNGITRGGYPKLRFSGVLGAGGVMDLKLDWGSVMFTGEEQGGTGEKQMKAHRISE